MPNSEVRLNVQFLNLSILYRTQIENRPRLGADEKYEIRIQERVNIIKFSKFNSGKLKQDQLVRVRNSVVRQTMKTFGDVGRCFDDHGNHLVRQFLDWLPSKLFLAYHLQWLLLK